MKTCLRAMILFAGLLWSIQASAAVWIAERLRGDVYKVEDGEWVALARGDVVTDDTIVWSNNNGHAEFRSGGSLVVLKPSTQIKFVELVSRGQTVVQQWFGDVEVDVEARNVEHFAVQTPHMVAVVKGTRFSVSSDDDGAEVSVSRGSVEVTDTDNDHQVSLGSGQRVSNSSDGVMQVAGRGQLPAVINGIGEVVVPAPEPEPDSTTSSYEEMFGGGHSSSSDATPTPPAPRPEDEESDLDDGDEDAGAPDDDGGGDEGDGDEGEGDDGGDEGDGGEEDEGGGDDGDDDDEEDEEDD